MAKQKNTKSAASGSPKVKIPRSYRRPMKEKRFRRLQGMLTDNSERELMARYFPIGDSDKRCYKPPADKKAAKKINGILGKVYKARKGPRTLRLIILALLIGLPILFNLFFLDMTATRLLERFMEKTLETDVDIRGLDIGLMNGSVELAVLTIASTSDPMMDAVVVEDVAIDFRTAALIARRVNIDTLTGTLDFNRPRTEEAEYPVPRSGTGETGNEPDNGTPGSASFDWMPVPDLPGSSADLAMRLREEAEAEADRWAADLETDKDRIEALIDRTEAFVSEPLPDSSDIAGWKKRIDEGRSLAAEIESMKSTMDSYATRMDQAVGSAHGAAGRVQQAIEADLAVLEENFIPGPEMLNRWLEAALIEYAGPRAASLYGRVVDLNRRFGGGSGERKRNSGNGGRMKSGRIVHFPVNLPPRFTISTLDLRSGQSRLSGTDVGVDHELAGAPSILEAVLEGIPGVPGRITADAVLDGRESAEEIVSGSIVAGDLPWSVMSGGNGSSGLMAVDAVFLVPAGGTSGVHSSGAVRFSDWNGGEGNLSFIDSGSPPLGFYFEAVYENGFRDLSVSVDRSSVGSWGRVLASSMGSAGIDEARGRLEKSTGVELEKLDSVLDSWKGGEDELAGLDGAVTAAEEELNAVIEDMLSQSGIDLPVELPGTDALGGLLGGLGKKP